MEQRPFPSDTLFSYARRIRRNQIYQIFVTFNQRVITFIMQDVRLKIVEIVSQIPDSQLDNLLSYLEDIMKLREIDTNASEHLSKIIVEDDNLLKRLAQ
jgi:hypothetical protein